MERIRSKREILRRYIVFTISLFFVSLGVSLVTRSLTGTSPISSIPYVLSLNTILTMGTFILLLNIVLMAGQMIMLGKNGIRECKAELMLQIPVSIVFGLFVDLTMLMLGFFHPENYALKIASLILGCCCMAIGVSLEVIADVSMVSGEYFVHIASKRFKKEFGTVKIMFDISLVIVAIGCSWILAGKIDGVREGTIIVAILTGPLVRFFMPRLAFVRRWEEAATPVNLEIQTGEIKAGKMKNYPVVTISREYGSGGREIGRMLAEKLGWQFHDDELLPMIADESGINEDTVRSLDQRLPHNLFYEMITQDYSVPLEKSLSTKDALFVSQNRVIRKLTAEASCVIIGRCADYFLKDYPGVLSVFLFAPDKYKTDRAIKSYNLDVDKAEAIVEDINEARASHYAYYTGRRWSDPRNYDAVFDTSRASSEAICNAIISLLPKNTSE